MGNQNCDMNVQHSALLQVSPYQKLPQTTITSATKVQKNRPPLKETPNQFQKLSFSTKDENLLSKNIGSQKSLPIQIPISKQHKLLSSLNTNILQSKTQSSRVQQNSYKTTKNVLLKELFFSNYFVKTQNSQNKIKHRKIAIKKEDFYYIKNQPIEEYYRMDRKIGEGSFGSVYEGYCKRTKEKKAIKVLKKRYMSDLDESNMLAQVNILRKLDHINIIKLDDIFFNNSFYYIVTEYCEGGTLLQAIISKKVINQRDISIIMKQILTAVSYLTQMKIAHRDLKLQNIALVQNLTPNNIGQCVKIIDFGLAKQSPKFIQNTCEMAGTLSYMSPETFNNQFSCQSDIWSCGIILCIMLIGRNPFKKKTKQETKAAIQKKQIDFHEQQWDFASEEVKSILKKMLKKDPEKRMPISKILQEKWFHQENIVEDIDKNGFMDRISKYYRGSNFLAFIKNYIVSKRISQEEREQMATLFSKIDKNHSGFLQFQQILELYKTVKGTSLTAHMQIQLKKQIKKIDENRSGKIDFQQFLLLMSNMQNLKNSEYLDEAFDFFDRDKTGYIQREQLLDSMGDQDQVRNLIGAVDWNGDGKVSREQFVGYLQGIFSN